MCLYFMNLANLQDLKAATHTSERSRSRTRMCNLRELLVALSVGIIPLPMFL